MKNLKYSLLIVLAAFIWGSAFVAQSVGMNYIGPFTFGMARFYIGSIVLIPVILLSDRFNKTSSEAEKNLEGSIPEKSDVPKPFAGLSSKKRLILGGIICGII